jgi:hypothetical protein
MVTLQHGSCERQLDGVIEKEQSFRLAGNAHRHICGFPPPRLSHTNHPPAKSTSKPRSRGRVMIQIRPKPFDDLTDGAQGRTAMGY